MNHTFKTGQRVICIDNNMVESSLIVGKVYIITGIEEDGDLELQDKRSLYWTPKRFIPYTKIYKRLT